MPQYDIYGLCLDSAVHLPGLVPLRGPLSHPIYVKFWVEAESTIRPFRDAVTEPAWKMSPLRDAQGRPNLQVWQFSPVYYLRYVDGTEFVLNPLTCEIWAVWPDRLTLEDATTYLLGPILGFFLRLQGQICLHASAIAIADFAIAFVGASGVGKSTLAAGFAKQGYAVVSDDVVPLIEQETHFSVQPAYPYLRLWQPSVTALYGSADALPRLVPTHPTWDKRYLDLNQKGYHFQHCPLPLAAVYFLTRDQDKETQIQALSRRQGFVELAQNTSANYLLDSKQRSQEFEGLGRLVQTVRLNRITLRSDMARLPELQAAILKDCHCLTPLYE